MKKNSIKMWVAAGAVAATTSFGVAQAESSPSAPEDHPGYFHGDFDHALDLLLMGEGGESGLGLTKMWPSISAPALAGTQIKKLVSGNTLVHKYHYAMQLGSDGSVGGYTVDLVPSKNTKACPVPEVIGDGFLGHDGACYKKVSKPWAGKWDVKDHKLCIDVRYKGGELQSCWHVAMLMNAVVLFEPDGTMFGKGNSLVSGKANDE